MVVLVQVMGSMRFHGIGSIAMVCKFQLSLGFVMY